MKRILFPLFSGVSLLLCLAACLLWARSYGGSDYVGRAASDPADTTTHHEWFVQCTRGQLRLGHRLHMVYPPLGYQLPSGAPRTWWTHGRLGVGHMDWEPRPVGAYETGLESSFASTSERGVAIPMWLTVLVFGILPAIWLWRRLRGRRRIRTGLCSACGYDLRATPDRCPECGATSVNGQAA